jgi:hypothetical protein
MKKLEKANALTEDFLSGFIQALTKNSTEVCEGSHDTTCIGQKEKKKTHTYVGECSE